MTGVLEGQHISREDWEQSLGPYYQVDRLLPPEWSVSKSLGRRLSVVEGAPADNWCAQPEITLDQLLRQLNHLAQGMQQGCIYQGQESYFRYSQHIKEATHNCEAEQGHQYREGTVHVDDEFTGSILANVAALQQSLIGARGGQ